MSLLDRLLPGRAFEAGHAAGVADAREALRRALAEEASFPLMRWRVVGRVEGDDVKLWYTLRKRPPSLAPELVAKIEPAGSGGAKVAGAFTQNRRMALAVSGLGAVLAAGLLSVALQGGIPLYWAIIGGSFLVGYPWLAWFLYENHVEKIEALVRRALGAAPDAPADPREAPIPDETR